MFLIIVGSAVVMMATSRAEIKDSRQRATNTPQNLNECDNIGVLEVVTLLLFSCKILSVMMKNLETASSKLLEFE